MVSSAAGDIGFLALQPIQVPAFLIRTPFIQIPRDDIPHLLRTIANMLGMFAVDILPACFRLQRFQPVECLVGIIFNLAFKTGEFGGELAVIARLEGVALLAQTLRCQLIRRPDLLAVDREQLLFFHQPHRFGKHLEALFNLVVTGAVRDIALDFRQSFEHHRGLAPGFAPQAFL